MDESQWSLEEFGGARLGDQRRTTRLVAMGARAAAKPGGNITAVFSNSAEREGAFRFVENDEVGGAEITRAARYAAAARARGQAFVFAPVDGTSLNLPDFDGRRRLGRVILPLLLTRARVVIPGAATAGRDPVGPAYLLSSVGSSATGGQDYGVVRRGEGCHQ